MQTIPFFSTDIRIIPHSVSDNRPELIGKPITIQQFAGESRCWLYLMDNGDYRCSLPGGDFIEGPEGP